MFAMRGLVLAALCACAFAITMPGRGSDVDASLQPTQCVQGSSSLGRAMAQIYNSKQTFFQTEATKLGVDSAALAAVTKVESGTSGFASNGLMKIRFENHQFYKYYTNSGRDSARVNTFNQHFQYSSGQSWTGHKFRGNSGSWISCHGSQSSEWTVLQFAQGLDDTAAIKSASYGAAQIMGFNYATVDYSSPQQMFTAFSTSIKTQLQGLIKFIKNKPTCLAGVRSNDFVKFAGCYNGSGQMVKYGGLIKSAFDVYRTLENGSKVSCSGTSTGGGGGSSNGVGAACSSPLDIKGVCLDTTKTSSRDGCVWSSGLCPGSSSIKCCTAFRADRSNEGFCLPTSKCTGRTASGLCPGPSNVKACLAYPTGTVANNCRIFRSAWACNTVTCSWDRSGYCKSKWE